MAVYTDGWEYEGAAPDGVAAMLEAGWEPFAVTLEHVFIGGFRRSEDFATRIVHFKRKTGERIRVSDD